MDRISAWRMVEAGKPLELERLPMPKPGPGEVVLEVMACGLCHTDVGFLYGGVRPNAGIPITLGHEIVGRVTDVGDGCEAEAGDVFLVPAVLPCGDCDLCRNGRGNVCRKQKMPGNDFDGGFASHFVAPVRYLCPVKKETPDIEDLSVVADAVGTSFQAVDRCDVAEGDTVVVVGAGGVGTFAIQAAKLKGAKIVAIDVDRGRLEAVGRYVDLPLNSAELDAKAIRKAVDGLDDRRPGRKVIECSGVAAGQQTAFALLNHDAKLAVVGFTLEKIPVRLSNLMAFDATAFGNWGCLPEYFPTILRLVESGDIDVKPYVERFPMSSLNELLKGEGHVRRPVLIPDFES